MLCCQHDGVCREVPGPCEKLGWVKDAEEIIEISPQYKVTWGSALCHPKIKSDEYMAIARIAQGKAYLAKAPVRKAKIRAEWAKEKEESAE